MTLAVKVVLNLNTTNTTIVFHEIEKHHEKWRKYWLPAFSPFLAVFSKGFFLRHQKSLKGLIKDIFEKAANLFKSLWFIESWDCVGQG